MIGAGAVNIVTVVNIRKESIQGGSINSEQPLQRKENKMSDSVTATSQLSTASRAIPTKRITVNDPSQLPHDYSTTPGGTLFSTTPGGKLLRDNVSGY